MSQKIWSELAGKPKPELRTLFDEDKNRLARLSFEVGPLRFDWSKTHLTTGILDSFVSLAEEMKLENARDDLFSGTEINNSEGRAVQHMAERGEGNADAVALAQSFHNRMRTLIDAIESGVMGPVRHVLHVGIGGSALGPDLLVDALGRFEDRYDVAIVSNVDGSAMEEAIANFDPDATLLCVASKTFTTTETMLNANSAISWMIEGGVEDPYGKVVAMTASPEKAIEWGVDETRILPFSETVGGRYSLWSSIGFPAAVKMGWQAFAELLEGAAMMDRHFQSADLLENAPVLAAFADLYYARTLNCETRAVFAYDERLRLLPSYLQQLEMESNGKSVTRDGAPLDGHSAPITWGGVGTDAQHAVFQLLHQGTHLVPVEFIASREAGDTLDPEHHKALLVNCFAQGAALMKGRENNEDTARNYPGNRPSSTIMLDDVTPKALGALLAFYEHRTFVNAALMGINPFDQFGVELGKEIAKSIDSEGAGGFDPSTTALMAWAQID